MQFISLVNAEHHSYLFHCLDSFEPWWNHLMFSSLLYYFCTRFFGHICSSSASCPLHRRVTDTSKSGVVQARARDWKRPFCITSVWRLVRLGLLPLEWCQGFFDNGGCLTERCSEEGLQQVLFPFESCSTPFSLDSYLSSWSILRVETHHRLDCT